MSIRICIINYNSAFACSPNMQYSSMPLAMKLQGDLFFVGKVKSVDDDEVTFEIMVSGGPSQDKNVGDEIDFDRGNGQSTCGRKNFIVGDIWLYDGNDISFGPSQKLETSDLKDALTLESIKNNVIHRVDPDYVPPRQPLKEDLPVTGLYSNEQECGEADKALGYLSSSYTLEISKMNPITKMYKVYIDMNICKGGHMCSFSAEAPAYGYGEIILPVIDEEGKPISKCNVIVQQLSGVNDWPRLKEGEAKVILNDYSCQSYFKNCGAGTYLDSPVLKKVH